MICYLFPEPIYLFFSSDVPALLYYSHIPTVLVALIITFFIFLKGRNILLNRLLFGISLLFSAWIILNLIVWTNIHSNLILFFWSFFGLIFGLISVFCIYFIYVFLEKKDISMYLRFVLISLIIPILIFTPTNFNLSGFNLNNCDAFQFEGFIFQIYYVFLGVLAMFWIFSLLFRKYRISTSDFKKQILLIGIGIESFLFLFFVIIFLASYLTSIGILPDSQIEMYGLFGMVIFMVYISIMIVRFNTFNIKLFATQALVWGLCILIGSQFFFIKVLTNFILTGITLTASIIFGYFLIKSVKKEIEQKEELAKLNIDLQDLLKQRESLVHLVTHKVKGAFTRSKYIFAEMLDGTFGEINEEVKIRAKQGLESDNGGIATVDLVLNADNLQAGTVKYDLKTIDLKDLVEKVISEKKNLAEEKGIKFNTNIPNEICNISGDSFWIKEVINNLIENSIRYTREGEIEVGLKKSDKKFVFYVKDTGVGITEEDKKNLFTEGGRGKDSVRINVDSTGYGLFSVKLIINAHKGKVWMEDNKESHGSIFFVELDAA